MDKQKSQYSLRVDLSPDLKILLDKRRLQYRRRYPYRKATISEVIRYLIAHGGDLEGGEDALESSVENSFTD